ncbi:PREDICTED: uncharacterized protein LOC106344715 [Brassica oleracea var. oleracea]|uniref:uncharacterized protein LOC106344715 n=1 Tax=Brassica oleracea var. oleracea TaxID=109376 RepID=UPI0006A6C201|nr:PREDICTED: uncharacterized protein LOC106344715 [Brassica oleracea var. oleracea]
MAFTQMAPNFFRYFLGCWVRAQEEGLEFGLGELRQLFAIKRNNGFPGTMILAPRGGRGIIEGIPNKDDRWREKFFVFKINSASEGDFDFERIPREWSDDIDPFESAPMSPELRGLMETLRRGSTRWLSFSPDRIRAACALPPGANHATLIALVAPVRPKRGRGTKRKKEKEGLLDRPDESSEAGSLERARKVQRGQVLRPRSQAQSRGLLASPVSVAIPSGGAREAPDTSACSAGDRALNDEIDSSSHRSRRRVLEEINSVTSGSSSPRLSPPLRASGEGNSRVNPGVFTSSVPEAFSWSFAYDSEIPILENPDSLAAIWCKVRAEGCKLPSLEHMRERDTYVRMAVANAKAMEASNDYATLMEGRLANFPSKEEIAGHILTIQQLWGELDAAREAERQREVEIEELKKNLAAAKAEKVVVQSDLDSMNEKYRREIEGQDRKARKDLHLVRVSLAKEFEGVLAVVKGKLEQKKKETAAEILLQETRARIEALTEYSEGGYELELSWSVLKTWRIRSTSITVLLRCQTLLLVISISPRSPETRSARIDVRVISI